MPRVGYRAALTLAARHGTRPIIYTPTEITMAKDDRSHEKAKVKFRFVEFEMEGGSTALQETLRSVAVTISRGNSQQPPRVLQPKAPVSGTAQTTAAPSFDHDIQSDVIDHDEPLEIPPSTLQSENPKPKAKAKIPSYKIISIDLLSGDPSLKSFCEKFKLTTDNQRVLVIAYWLKENRSIASIGGDHILTCYKHMKWNVPKDVTSPLRNMKYRNRWFESGETPGTYAINHIGENEINDMQGTA